LDYRIATLDDVPLLASMNLQLVRDEHHRNASMTLDEMKERMYEFLAGRYTAVLFEDNHEPVAYALYCPEGDYIYLRQLFVARDRRRQGVGRKAVEILRERILPRDKRIVLDVLLVNAPGIAFWKSAGFKEYAVEMELLPEQDRAGTTEPQP
jgi:GNAT superfamily N-acetyltransferase